MQDIPNMEGPVCPMPLSHGDTIVMGHGSGGRMTHDLVQQVFLPLLHSSPLSAGNDFARLELPSEARMEGSLAVSTDAHIVSPLFFPGGDIGRLAVCGTVNDVAMSGATPLFLTAGFVIEEGLPVATLEKVAASMRAAAEEAGVIFAAGDTKVAERGNADGLFITTTGIGWLPPGRRIGGEMAQAGDAVLVSGTLGDHGIAVLGARGDLGFESDVQSDVAPLNKMINDLLAKAPGVHVMRDPTRGGLATTLNEIAAQSKVGIWLDEKSIPVRPSVQAACEMLGFDPLYVANEGKVIVILPEEQAGAALAALREHPYGKDAAWIGSVRSDPARLVLMKTLIGGTRIVDVLAGEMLPRIC